MSTPYSQQPEQQPSGPRPHSPTFRICGVPQGFAPGSVPVTQGAVTQKVNRVSIILGVVGWARPDDTGHVACYPSQHPTPTRVAREADGFSPPLCADVIGPVNPVVLSDCWGSGEAEDAKLNWLGNPPER